MKALRIALAFALISVSLSLLYYELPINLDSYESARAASELQRNSFPISSPNYGAAPATYYPPLFSFAAAHLSNLSAIEPIQSIVSLSFLFAIAISMLIFIFSRKHLPESTAAIASTVSFAIPSLFYRIVNPIPETLGFSLLLVCLVLYEKKSRHLSFFLLLFSLVHFRSFVVALLTLAIQAFKEKQLAKFIYSAIPALIIFTFTFPSTAFGFSNEFIISPPFKEFSSEIFLLLAVLGAFLFLLKNKIVLQHLSLLLSTIFTFLTAPFSFRQFLYLSPLLQFYSAFLAKHGKFFAYLIVIATVFSSAFFLHYRAPPISMEQIELLKHLEKYDGTVAADFKLSYAIPYYSGKKVVAGAFLEGVADGRARASDLQKILNGNTRAAQKYNAKIFVDVATEGEKIYSSNSHAVYLKSGS